MTMDVAQDEELDEANDHERVLQRIARRQRGDCAEHERERSDDAQEVHAAGSPLELRAVDVDRKSLERRREHQTGARNQMKRGDKAQENLQTAQRLHRGFLVCSSGTY